MITKKTFCEILSELNIFYNNIMPKMEAAGFNTDDSLLVRGMDAVLESLHNEVDPENLGEYELTWESPILYEWIFTKRFDSIEEAQTPEGLYDWIMGMYKVI